MAVEPEVAIGHSTDARRRDVGDDRGMKRLGPVLCPIIVGRDDLLRLFDRLIAEVGQGRGRAVFLAGPAGLGKTRLNRAIARAATAAGLRVDGGALAPHDRQVPMASIRDMANGMRNDAEFGTLPADLLAIDGRHDGDALGARRLLVRDTADRILAAMDRPTLLVFDDLHWADELSLEVIGELARRGADRPLLLVGGYRADEFPPGSVHREWRARLLNQRYAEEARLRPLTLEETGVATTLILGRDLPAPRDVVEAVYERTNGIPLHIEELLAVLDDDARSDGSRIREAQVPDTLADAIVARFERLSEDARLVARAGAVVGRCFSPDLIAGMVDRPLHELEPCIAELVHAAVLYPFDYVDEGYYDFRHQLLRDAVYDTVPPTLLRRFHAQAAEFGMSLKGASVIHASRHYERAGLRAQAFRASLAGAREASRISARREAYELYRRAIENMPPDMPAAEQGELYEAFSDAAGAIERVEESRTAGVTARERFLAAGRPIDAARLQITLAVIAGRNAEPNARQRAIVDRGLEELAALPPSAERRAVEAVLLACRAHIAQAAPRPDDARRDVAAARTLAEAVGDDETVLEAEILEARLDMLDGRLDVGLANGLRAARAARDAGFESAGVTGYRNLAELAARVLAHDAARTAIAEGVRFADAIEQSHCRQQMAATLARLEWGAGNWDAADELARLELVERGCRRGELGALDVLGLVAMSRGRFDEARRWLDEALAAGRSTDETIFVLPPLWGLAETELHAGDPVAAWARCEEALRMAVERQDRALLIPFVVTGARAALASRRPTEAQHWLDAVTAHLAGWSPATAALAHAEGLIRMATGSPAMARTALEAAIRGWADHARTWERLWAELDLVACLARLNRHPEAATRLNAARAAADRLGSAPLLARADELDRLVRSRHGEEEAWRPLTAREFEVASLIAAGRTNGEIAEELSIAPKTVSAHVEHILAKLGVNRRTEVAAWVTSVAAPVAAGR